MIAASEPIHIDGLRRSSDLCSLDWCSGLECCGAASDGYCLEAAVGGCNDVDFDGQIVYEEFDDAEACDCMEPVGGLLGDGEAGGALDNLETATDELSTIFKLPDYGRFATFDPPINAVGDESDSDDGNNGDFEELKDFQEVVASRTANSSRASSTGSWSPPTCSWPRQIRSAIPSGHCRSTSP